MTDEQVAALAEVLTDALAGTNLAKPLQASYRSIFADQGEHMAEWLVEHGYSLVSDAQSDEELAAERRFADESIKG